MNESLEDQIAKAADKVARRFRRRHMADDLPPVTKSIQRLASPYSNQHAGHEAAKKLTALLADWRRRHPQR